MGTKNGKSLGTEADKSREASEKTKYLARIEKLLKEPVPKGVVGELMIWSSQEQREIPIPFVPIGYIYERANEVFGEFNYNVEIKSIKDDQTIPRRRNDKMIEYVVITAHITITVDIFEGEHESGPLWSRSDGVGTVTIERDKYLLSIDGARSKAVAAGVKKAFKRFGPTFGLGLGTKDVEDVSQEDIVTEPGEAGEIGEGFSVKYDMDEYVKGALAGIDKAKDNKKILEIASEVDSKKKALSGDQYKTLKDALVKKHGEMMEAMTEK